MEQHAGGLKRKVLWTREQKEKLRNYVISHGARDWDTIARKLDIGKSGNSCRLEWVNYLNPDIVRGKFTNKEMLVILKHRFEGNGWSKIAKEYLPGRSDNDIKNFWNTRMKKEAKQLNCEVKSEEFLNKMTAILMERIQAVDSTGGSWLTADGASTHVVDSGPAQELIMNCTSHGESIRAYVDAFLDGQFDLPDDQDCFDIDKY